MAITFITFDDLRRGILSKPPLPAQVEAPAIVNGQSSSPNDVTPTLTFQVKSIPKTIDPPSDGSTNGVQVTPEDPKLYEALSIIEENPNTDRIKNGYFRTVEIKEDATRLKMVSFLLTNPDSKHSADLAANPALITNATYRELLLEQAMDERYENTEFAYGYGKNTGLFIESNLETIFNFVTVKKNASKKFSLGVSNNESLLSENTINWFNKFLPEGKPEIKGAIIIESENRLQSWACNQHSPDNLFVKRILERFVAAANAYGEQKMLLEGVLEYFKDEKADQEPHTNTLKALDLTNKTTRLNLISYAVEANATNKTAFIVGTILKENKEKLSAKEIKDIDEWSRDNVNKNHLFAKGWLTFQEQSAANNQIKKPAEAEISGNGKAVQTKTKVIKKVTDKDILALQAFLTEDNKGWSSEGKVPLPHYFNREIFKQKPQIAALIKIKDGKKREKFIKCAQNIEYRGTDAVMFFGQNPTLLNKEAVKTLIPWLKENPNHLFAYGIARNSTLLKVEVLPIDERERLINWAKSEGKQTRSGNAIQKLFKV